MEFSNGKKAYEIEFGEIDGVTVPEARFFLRTITPALGEATFSQKQIKTVKGTTGIEFLGRSQITKAACGGKQAVLYSITPEAEQWIVEVAAAEIEEFRAAAQEKPIEAWEYAFGGDSWTLYLSPVELTPLEAHVRQDVEELRTFANYDYRVNEYLTAHGERIERDSGIYTRDGWKRIGDEELQAVVAEARAAVAAKKAAAEAARQAKYDAALRQAQETDKPVMLSTKQVPCNDPREECDCDNIVTYVEPDGTTSKQRYHTW